MWLAGLLLAATTAFAQTRPTPVQARAMHDAIAAAEHGDEAGALRLVGALVQSEPDFVPGLKLQAVLLEDTGQQEAAARAYTRALELAPQDPELELKVGILELVQKHTDRAVELLRAHTEAVPTDPDGFFYLAQALHRRGDDTAAVTAARKAVELAPANAAVAQKYGELLCSSGDCTAAVEWLKKAQAQDPSLARLQYDLAFASFQNQDLEQAEAYAKQSTEEQPADEDAWSLLGSIRVKLAEWDAAEPALEHVLQARPHDAGVLLELGHCQLELKQYPASVESLKASLAADPTEALAHFFLARAYAAEGNQETAKHEADLHARMMQEFSFDVPRAAREHEAAMSEKARALLEKAQEQKAVELFQADSKQAHGTEASAWLAVGATWLRMNRIAESERALRHALMLDPKVKGAYTYLGYIALEQGNLPLAETDFSAELKNDPNHPQALAELGEVRYRQGRWAEAVDALVRSKTAEPRFLFMLADSYFHLGKTDAADLTAESLAAHAHDQPEVLQSLAALLRRNGQAELADRLGLK